MTSKVTVPSKVDIAQCEMVKSKSENSPANNINVESEIRSVLLCWKSHEEPINYKLISLVWISRIIPIGAALCAFGYIIYLLANSDNWSTDSSSPDAEKLRREASRGLFVSVVIALLLNLIGALMFYIKVKESLVVINYGFILGPVIGFILDQSIGTDAGFTEFMTTAGFSYTFSSLIGGNFMRYIVTVFLDLFISNPLQDILKTQAAKIGVIKILKNTIGKKEMVRRYDAFVAMNFPSILQSIVAFVTFNAYTNQTRFAWAYPNLDLDRELRIPPGTIMLSTAIAGVLYLNFYVIMSYLSERDYFDINTKLLYVLAILALLYGLNQTESIEAPISGEIDKEYTKSISSAKPFLGMLTFTFFVLYGFVYPIYTRMGCCGKWKPKESELEHDHLAEVEHETEYMFLTGDMIEQISNEINYVMEKMIAYEMEMENKKKKQMQINSNMNVKKEKSTEENNNKLSVNDVNDDTKNNNESNDDSSQYNIEKQKSNSSEVDEAMMEVVDAEIDAMMEEVDMILYDFNSEQ